VKSEFIVENASEDTEQDKMKGGSPSRSRSFRRVGARSHESSRQAGWATDSAEYNVWTRCNAEARRGDWLRPFEWSEPRELRPDRGRVRTGKGERDGEGFRM